MQTYIKPVSEPYTLLNGFNADQSTINAVDGKRIHATEKFKELADMAPPELAFEHLFIVFQFCLPIQLVLEIQTLSAEIRVTAEMEGMLCKGLMSASLMTWKRFILLATRKEQSDWLNQAANTMHASTFISIPYFKDLILVGSALVKK